MPVLPCDPGRRLSPYDALMALQDALQQQRAAAMRVEAAAAALVDSLRPPPVDAVADRLKADDVLR